MMPVLRRVAVLLVAFLLIGPVAACGRPEEPGGLEGQVLGMLSPTEQPILLSNATIIINGPGGTNTALTDATGRYTFSELRAGNYGMAASYNGPQAAGKRLQTEERTFSVSEGQQETISLVLLEESITPPPDPPAAPATAPGGQQSAASGGGGLMSNPFFWYFLFNQPFGYGYGRPPVVAPGGGGPVIDNNQPQRTAGGRVYTEYGDANTTGVRTKPPPAVTSKGTTRPGAGSTNATGGSAPTIRPPSPNSPAGGVATPAARPPSSGNNPATTKPSTGADSGGSKGTTRPGASSGSAPSVKPPAARPPAVRPPSVGRRGR